MSSSPCRSAWREPMFWLVVALPAGAVCAGFATLALALHEGGADASAAQVRRTAQIQVEDLASDRRAADLGLAAEMRLDARTGALTLSFGAGPPANEAELELQLLHPTRAAADRVQPLVRSGAHWFGRIEPDSPHAWNLRLTPADGSWRLHGRLAAGAQRANLLPSVAP